ncbi:MAG: hypothetical protein ABSE20_23645 [Acetobacteraceae bacterium]|jgi:hypothetical protein
MIRPVTLVCWILALSAGLYLYHAKHEVELIDQHIDQIAKQTADLRVESRGLLDEWIRLGEPEQLHRYSDEYLGLQPIAPGQFARVSDLPARLPPPQPDPPADQADVVAQSSGGASAGVASPEGQPSGNQADSVQVAPSDPAATDQESENTAGADDIPVPPIPPATVPVAATAAAAATALPLQARPVSPPRLADDQMDPEAARPRAAASSQGSDDLRADAAIVTPGEPHQGPAGPINAQGPGVQVQGLPPLQAQAPRNAPGLPPLQTQGQTREVAQGSGRPTAQGQGHVPGSAIGQASGQSALRPAEPRTTETRLNEPPRETRPIEPQPGPRQAMEPHDPRTPFGRQGQLQTEQAQVAPVQGGSLLGMSRSSVPLPLPAPTPVNANWSGPGGTGSLGPGR